MRKRYTDGQEDQLGTLGLVTNAVVLWNIFICRQPWMSRAQGETLNDEDIARLSALPPGLVSICSAIIPSRWQELVTKGHLRPLKESGGRKRCLT
ncbi:Tn3 family transposase [Klebsiella pneumoniae]|uniref:Tn3 family transposase n=1 Tax=Klebsiella pneumoniae TaxID=573 RepID=UPI00388D3157